MSFQVALLNQLTEPCQHCCTIQDGHQLEKKSSPSCFQAFTGDSQHLNYIQSSTCNQCNTCNRYFTWEHQGMLITAYAKTFSTSIMVCGNGLGRQGKENCQIKGSSRNLGRALLNLFPCPHSSVDSAAFYLIITQSAALLPIFQGVSTYHYSVGAVYFVYYSQNLLRYICIFDV